MQEHLKAAQLALESIHPAAPWVLLTLAIFAAVYAVRKWLPGAWAALDRVTLRGDHRTLSALLQSLGVTGASAIAAVFLSGGDFGAAWRGAMAGALAPVLHWVLRLAPGPYGAPGAPDEADGDVPPVETDAP